MNILIAPDSFKDCLSAREVALALGRGIRKFLPNVKLTIAPMADGGEGTVESVVDATGGEEDKPAGKGSPDARYRLFLWP